MIAGGVTYFCTISISSQPPISRNRSKCVAGVGCLYVYENPIIRSEFGGNTYLSQTCECIELAYWRGHKNSYPLSRRVKRERVCG